MARKSRKARQKGRDHGTHEPVLRILSQQMLTKLSEFPNTKEAQRIRGTPNTIRTALSMLDLPAGSGEPELADAKSPRGAQG